MRFQSFKKLIILLFLGIFFSNDNALTIGDNNRQIGLFKPFIIGTPEIEISTHPLLFLIKPNFKIKKYLGKRHNLDFAGRFGFDYPSLLLKTLEREGTGGVLSIDETIDPIPHLFILSSELLLTKKIAALQITNKIGLSLCPGCDLDSRNIIDLPIIYPRMKLYDSKILQNVGLDIKYFVSEKIKINTDLDFLIIPKENTFIEHKLLFNYFLSKKISFTTGYKLVYGKYPYGKYLDLFPLLDITFYWTDKK